MTCSVELVEDERYAPGLVAASLESQFGRDWPQTTGMAENGLVRFAMAALLEYLHDTQIKGVERLKTVVTYNEAQFMRLSPVTRANLELTETLRGRESGHAALGAGQDQHGHGQAHAAQLDRAAVVVQQAHQPAPQRGGEPCAADRRARRPDRRAALHCRHGAPDDPHGLWLGHPKEIYTLAQTCERLPVLRQQATACGCPELAELAEEIDPLEDIKARIYAAVDRMHRPP